MAGAANNTTGSMMIQASTAERSQCERNAPSLKNGALATAAATAEVNPDWITPNTK